MPEPSFDLRATIRRHPWPAVAIALCAGGGLALAERSRSALVRVAALAAGSALVAAARELAVRELAAHARSWSDQRDRAYARDAHSRSTAS